MEEKNMEECCVCGAEEEKEQMKKVDIKGKIKYVCEGCVTAIKGFA
jgi:hypothetical protein